MADPFGPAPVRNEGAVIPPEDVLHYRGDGIALTSTSHPRPSFWRRIWFWLFPPRLHADALEIIEIEIPDEDPS